MEKGDLKKFKDEICRHFDVIAEDLKDNLKIIAEQVGANTEKLQEHDERFNKIEEKLQEHDQRFNKIEKKLQDHDDRFNKIDESLEIIKLDIEFIKNELKQKVSRDEFAALEKRVARLEAKIK